MSKFPEPEKGQTFVSGRPIGGVFECQTCGKAATGAVHDAREQRLMWTCPDGHDNSIHFKI